MRSLLLLTTLLFFGLTVQGCMLPNFGGNDEDDSSSDAAASEEEKEVPGRDDNSGNDAGNTRASAGNTRTENGTLASGDQTLNTGEFADLYNVNLDAGETIVVEMTSSQFDPYLILRPPGSSQVDNDDFEGDRTRSRIEYVATQSGNFDVIATSFQVGESGAYTVTIQSGQGIGGGAQTTEGSGAK